MTNLNLIDDYLANRMNDADKIAFEERLASDNELRQEFNFHKEVVNSIKEARRVELKSMLNDIPVSSGTNASVGLGTKIVTGLVTGALVIAGLYYFLQEDTEFTEEQLTTNEQVVESEPQQAEKENTDVIEEQNIEEDIIEEDVTPQEFKEEPKKQAEKPKVTKPADISTPNVMDFETEEDETADPAAPEAVTEGGDFSVEELFNSSIEVITDDSRKKYDFHYKFEDEKLFLFGDFDKDLYQILEFNNESGRTIFLYYKDNYYLLDENQHEIEPLKEIENEQLKAKLNSLRK